MNATMDREFKDLLHTFIVFDGNQLNEHERNACYDRVIRLVEQLEQQIAELEKEKGELEMKLELLDRSFAKQFELSPL